MKKKMITMILIIVIILTASTSFASAATAKKTGLYKEKGQWVYFENGQRSKATGLVQRPDKKTWHYVENGVYKKVTGLVQCVQPGSYKNKWYFVNNGNLEKVTGIVKCVQPNSTSKNKWFYVKKGAYTKSTGTAKCVQPGSKYNGTKFPVVKGKANMSTPVVPATAVKATATSKTTTATTVAATTAKTATTVKKSSIGLPNGTMNAYTVIGYKELCNDLQKLIDENKIVRYNNYFAGHNPGAMSHVNTIQIGSKVRVSDANGGYRDYKIVAHTTGKGSFADVNFAGYGNLWDIVQKGGFVIQFCKNGTNNFFYGI